MGITTGSRNSLMMRKQLTLFYEIACHASGDAATAKTVLFVPFVGVPKLASRSPGAARAVQPTRHKAPNTPNALVQQSNGPHRFAAKEDFIGLLS